MHKITLMGHSLHAIHLLLTIGLCLADVVVFASEVVNNGLAKIIITRVGYIRAQNMRAVTSFGL